MLKSYNLVQNLLKKKYCEPHHWFTYTTYITGHIIYTEFSHDCIASVGVTSVRIVHDKMEVKMTFINKKMEKKMALIHNN